MKLMRPMQLCQACGQSLDQDQCWGHVFYQCPGLLPDTEQQDRDGLTTGAPDSTPPTAQATDDHTVGAFAPAAPQGSGLRAPMDCQDDDFFPAIGAAEEVTGAFDGQPSEAAQQSP